MQTRISRLQRHEEINVFLGQRERGQWEKQDLPLFEFRAIVACAPQKIAGRPSVGSVVVNFLPGHSIRSASTYIKANVACASLHFNRDQLSAITTHCAVVYRDDEVPPLAGKLILTDHEHRLVIGGMKPVSLYANQQCHNRLRWLCTIARKQFAF